MSNINICLSCDDNYAPYAGVVIASVLINSRDDENLIFYVLQNSLSMENKEKLSLLKKIKECEIHFIEIPQSSVVFFKTAFFSCIKKCNYSQFFYLLTYLFLLVFIGSAAIFVFFSASARARVVSADFFGRFVGNAGLVFVF